MESLGLVAHLGRDCGTRQAFGHFCTIILLGPTVASSTRVYLATS